MKFLINKDTHPLFETDRLIIKKLAPDESTIMFQYRNDPEVNKYQLWHPENEAEIINFIISQQKISIFPPEGWLQFGIHKKSSGDLIGDCGLNFTPEKPDDAEIGYTISKNHWRNGFASETLTALIEYSFSYLKLYSLTAIVDPENIASIRMLENMHFIKIALIKNSIFFNDRWLDDLVFKIYNENHY